MILFKVPKVDCWQAAAIQGGTGLAGSIISGMFNDDLVQDQMDAQREFAQNGISWKVADALRAGINPLAALGVMPSTYNPVNVGDKFPGLADHMGKLGQGLGKLLETDSPETRRLQQLAVEQQEEQLKKMKLENVGLQDKVNKLNAAPVVDMRSSMDKSLGILPGQAQAQGQAEVGPNQAVEFSPVQIPYSQKPGIEAGIKPFEQRTIDSAGNIIDVPTQQLQEALEDNIYAKLQYYATKISQWATGIGKIGDRQAMLEIQSRRPEAPPGWEYRYNVVRGTFVPHKKVTKDDSRFYDRRYGKEYPYIVRPLKEYQRGGR